MIESRILIVESDAALRQKLYRGMLDVEIFSDCASTAHEAIGFLTGHRYAILILDVAVAGSEMIVGAVQRLPDKERPIILATAETDNFARVEAEGVQVVIRRPLHVRDVAELARACVDASARPRRKPAAGAQEDKLRV